MTVEQTLCDLKTADNSGNTITNPGAITGHNVLVRQNHDGALLRVRMGYTGGEPVTDPVIQVFGRYSSDHYWQPVRNKNNDLEVTLVTAATDAGDGTTEYTSPDNELHTFDCDGFNEFLFAVKTATAATTAVLYARFI